MLTLLINETKPLAGLFASTTGGIGSVPDISVADEGQAVSVQTFTRTAGVITDSFVAGDVLHIGIGDGVNAPVCYIELSSASPATGTMAINTVGMVALFAATSANQLTLNVGVVRTRGGYTNTIFSAPIVIHRSVIDPDTAVPTPSILGTGVAAALLVAINTALGFVRLDASARLPAVDGSQLTNLPNTGGVTSITGTANEITVTGTTTPTLSLPSAMTFTGKTVTGGTFTGGAFNGTVGATTPSTIAGTTGTFSDAVSTSGSSATISTVGADAEIYTGGLYAYIYTTGANAQIYTAGANAYIFTDGSNATIYTGGLDAYIYTTGANAHIYTSGAGAYIQTRSTFKLNSGTYTTTLSHAPTANRAIALPNAAGTLALTTDITGGTLAGSFTTLTASATTSLLLGTAGSAVGNIGFRNATSGTTTLAPATGALGTGTVTLPLSGTLATLAGTEAFTGKTYEGNTLTTGTGTLTLSTFTLTAATTGTVFTSGTKADVLDAACFAADAGANDTYTATLSPAITAYVTGAHYRFKANTANTGAATINLNSLGAKTIVKAAGGITTTLADNDIRAGQWVDLVYDGTNMQMQSTLGNAASGGGGSTNLWIPASAWIPKTTAGCGVDSRETATNDQNFDELLFDTASDEFADALVIMPSNYNNGTVTARFYWTAASGSGTVEWAIRGRAFANDDALDTAAGTKQSVNDTLIAADDMHITAATSACTIGGTPAANTPVQFTIYRDVSEDTLAVDARLLGVEIIFN